jgi:hypothetical protein
LGAAAAVVGLLLHTVVTVAVAQVEVAAVRFPVEAVTIMGLTVLAEAPAQAEMMGALLCTLTLTATQHLSEPRAAAAGECFPVLVEPVVREVGSKLFMAGAERLAVAAVLKTYRVMVAQVVQPMALVARVLPTALAAVAGGVLLAVLVEVERAALEGVAVEQFNLTAEV